MAHILQTEFVKYACTCGSLKPITKMYFCRHCLKLRCGYCVCHEVDSHYCSNCLENLPSSEARLKKNRCATCFDCPNCFHTLSIRATSISRSAEDGSKSATKLYYLACFFCRWTSRDVGIPDQTAATGHWPERENEHSERITGLIEHYKALAIQERIEKEKKSYHTPHRSYFPYSKFGITSALARKRAGLSSLGLGRDADLGNPPAIKPSVATDEIDPLPESMFSTIPDLTKVTTLSQRFSQPDLQPEKTSDLSPIHKHLFIKRSQRCRECEHNVYKPEYNPSSIRFKIQLAAFYHIPEITLLSVEKLKEGVASEVILKLCNPTQHITSVDFRPLPTAIEEELLWERAVLLCEEREKRDPQRTTTSNAGSGRDSLVLSSLGRELTLSEPPRRIEVSLTASAVLPTGGVVLPPRDDAAEYDDSGETHNFQDDPQIVVWRKGNKAAIKLTVTPYKDSKPGTPVLFGFTLCYGYVNTIAALEQKEPQRVDLEVKVYITPGVIEEKEEEQKKEEQSQ